MDLNLNVKGIDLDKASAGVWIDYDKNISFRIARANTPEYRAAVRAMTRQHKRQIDTGTLSDELSDELMAGLMAKHILLDWKGLKNGGQDWAYSVANAELFLKDERYFEIREWIMMQANDQENYREQERKK